MELHVLVGQRKCDYPGEYAPEALEVIDGNGDDDNPGFLMGEQLKYEKSNEFDALAVVRIFVANVDINAALYPRDVVIDSIVL